MTKRAWWQTLTATALGVLAGTVATAGTAAVAWAGFTLSFDAMRAVAIASHVRIDWAWMFPISVDGAMAVATVVAVVLYRLTGRHQWYPWAVLGIGAVISMLCNGVHATGQLGQALDLPAEVRVPVSAVPSLMLTLAVHLLVTLVSVVSDRVSGQPDNGTTTDVPTGDVQEAQDIMSGQGTDTDMSRTWKPDPTDTDPMDTDPDSYMSGLVSRIGQDTVSRLSNVQDTDTDMSGTAERLDRLDNYVSGLSRGQDMSRVRVQLSDADETWLDKVSSGGVQDTDSPAVPVVSGQPDSGTRTRRVRTAGTSDWDKAAAVKLLSIGNGVGTAAAIVFGDSCTAAEIKRVARLRSDMAKLTRQEFKDKHGVPLPGPLDGQDDAPLS